MTLMGRVKSVFGLKSNEKAQLTGTCQNCGMPIFSPDKGNMWLHRSALDSENCTRPQLRVVSGSEVKTGK